MKRYLSVLVLALIALFQFSCGNDPTETVSTQPPQRSAAISEEVGEIRLPYSDMTGNAVWDLKLLDDYLYVGAGDFHRNLTVGTAYRYDLFNGVWEDCGNIPDEQIGRFVVLDGKPAVPGIDPTGSWDLGNYYVLQDGSFQTYRIIPGAIHNFDITDHSGERFFALGVSPGDYPVKVLSDGIYREVTFTAKNGEPLSTLGYKEVRAYDLFTINGELYALISLDGAKSIYKYYGSGFCYHTDCKGKIIFGAFSYVPVLEKKLCDSKIYFTTGLLYESGNMKDFRDVTPADIDYVSDILVFSGKLYVLANKKAEDGNTVTVLKRNGDGSYSKEAIVETDLAAMSFEYDGRTFYVGLGTKDSGAIVNSRIIMIKDRSKAKK